MILEKEYKKNTSLAHRKKFAQFFTPEPIAKIMVDWVLEVADLNRVLEPAFGLGVFSRLLLSQKQDVSITAYDVDPEIFGVAKKNFDTYGSVNLHLEDYLFNDWDNRYDGILCNPPYFKFHDYENKKSLDEIKSRLNISLSGFTNIYTLFLLKSIFQLKEAGRAAYIVPSEFLNSDYGKWVKQYLISSKVLRQIIVFDFNENVFDDALTTSTILLLEKSHIRSKVQFSFIGGLAELLSYPQVQFSEYDLSELDSKVKWRGYYQNKNSERFSDLIPFKYVAKVVRGIATGSNEYFTFNQSKAKYYNIENDFLLPCISKSKDVDAIFFTKAKFEELEDNDAKVYLFDALKDPANSSVSDYIALGVEQGVNHRYLTSKRTPWYSLENRPPSPIWVGVFNRYGLKFIRNEAGTRNLTTFHCIYRVSNLFYDVDTDLLFAYLLTDVAKDIFSDNRREYGDGLKKFEPNDLNNAMMLDLSKLDEEEKTKILSLYKEYRISCLSSVPIQANIDEINSLLINKFVK